MRRRPPGPPACRAAAGRSHTGVRAPIILARVPAGPSRTRPGVGPTAGLPPHPPPRGHRAPRQFRCRPQRAHADSSCAPRASHRIAQGPWAPRCGTATEVTKPQQTRPFLVSRMPYIQTCVVGAAAERAAPAPLCHAVVRHPLTKVDRAVPQDAARRAVRSRPAVRVAAGRGMPCARHDLHLPRGHIPVGVPRNVTDQSHPAASGLYPPHVRAGTGSEQAA